MNCKHGLDKIKKDSTNLVQDMSAYFQPYSDTDCSICNISITKHRKLTNAHIKLYSVCSSHTAPFLTACMYIYVYTQCKKRIRVKTAVDIQKNFPNIMLEVWR